MTSADALACIKSLPRSVSAWIWESKGAVMAGQAAEFIGDIPGHYDGGLGPVLFEQYAKHLGGLVAAGEPQKVLELASGTGISTRHLRNALPASCGLVASDLNDPMLSVARQKFASEEKVDFEIVDASNIPFEEGSFDCVTCQFGVMFLPDKESSHREVKRVLKAGRPYVFSLWDDWAANPFAQIAHEATASFFPDNPPGFYKVPFHYHDNDEIERTLRSAGFEGIGIDRVRLDQPVSSFANFTKGLVHGNPLYDEVKDRGGVDPDAVEAMILKNLHDAFGPDGATMPLQALFVTARKTA